MTGNPENHTIKSSDLYECAFYFVNECTVKDIQIIEENKKMVCVVHMTGDLILSLQQIYFRNEAIVNLLNFRRAYNRLMSIVSIAKKQAKGKGGGHV